MPCRWHNGSLFRGSAGVNNRWDLTKLERYFQQSMAKKLALAGATIIDPNRIDIRGDNVCVSHDVVIERERERERERAL